MIKCYRIARTTLTRLIVQYFILRQNQELTLFCQKSQLRLYLNREEEMALSDQNKKKKVYIYIYATHILVCLLRCPYYATIKFIRLILLGLALF